MGQFVFGDLVVSEEEILGARFKVSYGWREPDPWGNPANYGKVSVMLRGRAESVSGLVPGEDAGESAVSAAVARLEGLGLTTVPEGDSTHHRDAYEPNGFERFVLKAEPRAAEVAGHRHCCLCLRGDEVTAVVPTYSPNAGRDNYESRSVEFRGNSGSIGWLGADPSFLSSLVG